MSSEKGGDGLFVDVKPAAAAKPAAKGSAGVTPKIKNVKQRWLYLAGGLIALVIMASSFMHSTPPVQARKEDTGGLVNVTPPGVEQKNWAVQSQADIKSVQQKDDELANKVATLQAEIDKQKNAPSAPAGIVAPPTLAQNSISTSKSTVVPPPPISQSEDLPQQGLPRLSGNKSGVIAADGTPPLPAIPPPYTKAVDKPVQPMVFMPDPSQSAAKTQDSDLSTKVKYKKNPQTGLMVAGAFAPVVLLNGIDAGTSTGSRSNPLPVLIRIQDNAILPGSSKYALKSCFILASGYGDLSAERVYIRLARLSCVDRTDRLVLSVPVQGYVVDSDNTLGMRGTVVDRQGARLGKAMLAGFAQGLGSALGGAQGTVTSSALGAATSVTGSEALRASGLSGVSSASSQLAEFYLKEAESIFPVIEIDGGRTASIVFTEDAQLEWGNVDEQFVRTEEPTNK